LDPLFTVVSIAGWEKSGRVVGVSKQAAQKAYFKALHRNTDQDISTHHRSELAELDAEASAAWELVDTKDSPKARAAGLAALNRIHIRRAHLLGLDAPTKLDVRGLYRTGIDEISAERQARRAVLEALPIEEQRRIFEVFYQARKRVAIAPNERWRSRNATICSSRRAISCLACAVFVSPPPLFRLIRQLL
jgi:hypothetical protein